MAVWFAAGILDQKWVIHFIDSPQVIYCAVLQSYEIERKKCPGDLVLVLLSSSICGSCSERSLFYRKNKNLPGRVTLLFPQYLTNVKLSLLAVGEGIKFLKSFCRNDNIKGCFVFNFPPIACFICWISGTWR